MGENIALHLKHELQMGRKAIRSRVRKIFHNPTPGFLKAQEGEGDRGQADWGGQGGIEYYRKTQLQRLCLFISGPGSIRLTYPSTSIIPTSPRIWAIRVSRGCLKQAWGVAKSPGIIGTDSVVLYGISACLGPRNPANGIVFLLLFLAYILPGHITRRGDGEFISAA